MKLTVHSVGSLFTSGEFVPASLPDNAISRYGAPGPDFVLCRDESNFPFAIYGNSVWDFNPYRLSATKIPRMRFDRVFGDDDHDPQQQALVEEAKYVLYCIIYFAGGGRIGKLSVSTLGQYWLVLRHAMQFCYEQKKRPMVGVLSLQQLLTVPVYLTALVRSRVFDQSSLSSILNSLARVGEERLGYSVVNARNFDLKRNVSNQHPVIPTRIYLDVINITGDLLEQMGSNNERLESFITHFSDGYYGITNDTQKSYGLRKAYYRPDFLQAIKDHNLSSVFSGEFACKNKRGLQRVLLNMQYVTRAIIQLYTGMRDQEVMRMSYESLSERIVRDSVFDDESVERDRAQSINILSTTTKLSGYRKEGAWFAPAEVVRAVKVAQAICGGLAQLYQIELDDRCPLFLNPSILCFTRNRPEIGVPSFKLQSTRGNPLLSMKIQAADLQELAQSDPTRNYSDELAFAVGQSWPLTGHQFRRSLAFYGSSSGFLSLPTLRTQFKHTSIEMSRYYANNYDKLQTIFGYYDDKKSKFVLPANHFAFEYQMAIPMAVANQLIADLLFTEQPLFGGTGSFMEKQKERLHAGEINIEDVRADTEQRVKGGAISYRPTLLGGCTKVGPCDSFMLGDYTECLSCEGAIIKPTNINIAIKEATDELTNYSEGSGEYQIVQVELERLKAFKARLMGTVEIRE